MKWRGLRPATPTADAPCLKPGAAWAVSAGRRTALVAAWGLGLLLLMLVGYRTLAAGQVQELDTFGDAPRFALIGQLSRPVSSDELRGRVVVADFIYTSCRDICPLLSARMQ